MPSGISVSEESGSPELIVLSAGVIILVLAAVYFVNEALQPVLAVEQQASSVTGSIASALSSIFNLLAAPFKWLLGWLGKGSSGSSSSVGITVTPAVSTYSNIGTAILDASGNPSCPLGYTPVLDVTGVYICTPTAQAPQQQIASLAPNEAYSA